MKVHDSALKHGVLPEAAVRAADWPLWVEPLDEAEAPRRELRPGFASADSATVAHMAEISAHTHHALDYVELGVTDFAEAKAFYGGAFGWTFTDYGPGPAYVGIRGVGTAEDVEVGGFRLDDEATTGGPLVLLYSSHLDSTAQAVRDAGGEVTQESYDFPGGRRFHFRDPSGNELGVWSTH